MALLIEHAKHELDLIGMHDTPDGDEMNISMRRHILHMVSEFAKEGHSGFSGAYAINLLTQLLKLQPLTELTGEDSEWEDRTIMNNGLPLFQNKRCSRVFKDSSGAYDIEAIQFYSDKIGEDGQPYREHFTTADSKVAITFPYMPRTQRVEYIEPTAPSTDTVQ
jgi:hypothetical protein